MSKKNSLLIELRNIHFSYPERKELLTGTDFTLIQGERLGLAGVNGCGKSTLLSVIMGLQTPQKGIISLLGKEMKCESDFAQARGKIGLVFQNSDDQLFCPTVLEDVAFGPLNLGKSKKEALELSEQVLMDVGLKGFEKRITYKLSGGEKRRVAIATVLAMEPEVLLLDEPTTGLDPAAKDRLSEVLARLTQSMVIVSHEADFVDNLTNTYVEMIDGMIVGQ